MKRPTLYAQVLLRAYARSFRSEPGPMGLRFLVGSISLLLLVCVECCMVGPTWSSRRACLGHEVRANLEGKSLKCMVLGSPCMTAAGGKPFGLRHLWMGTMNRDYLDNATQLLEPELSQQTAPASDAPFHIICREGDVCDASLPLPKAMRQMMARYAMRRK